MDVLFAVVVPFQVGFLDHWWELRPVGWLQDSVSLILLLTSWIGYHNSTNTSRWRIRFVNLPLVIFVLDVMMVLLYGFSAFAAEVGAKRGDAEVASATPVAVAVALSFALYAIWDWVNLSIKHNKRYQKAWIDEYHKEGKASPRLTDKRSRRYVTLVGLGASTTIAATAGVLNWPSGIVGTYTQDAALAAVLILYRLAKEWVPGKETVLLEERPLQSVGDLAVS